MEMPEMKLLECKFLLLRYVPDAVKNEFVNIGLVLLPPQAQPEIRFDKNWSRLLSLYPHADTELLDGLRTELSSDTDLFLTKIPDSFSNVLQASEFQGCLTSSPAEEADKLAKIYLEAPRHARPREMSAREAIRQEMRRAFESTGAWGAMGHEIAVSDYTDSGDPLIIDCGYGYDSTLKFFHATPLKSGVNAAKVLAFSYPAIAQGIRSKQGSVARLTAIVEDDLDRADATIIFALDILQRQAIQLAGVAELPHLAETAARELGLL